MTSLTEEHTPRNTNESVQCFV